MASGASVGQRYGDQLESPLMPENLDVIVAAENQIISWSQQAPPTGEMDFKGRPVSPFQVGSPAGAYLGITLHSIA